MIMRTDSGHVILALLLCLLPVTSQARRKRDKATLRFSDCGSDPDRPIHFSTVRAHPIPVIVPGTLYVTLAGNLTSDLPRRLTCHCPFLAGPFSVHNLALNVPRVHGYAGSLLNGDYKLVLTILGEQRVQLGCLELKFSMKKRHRGWLFKI
nr:hypothetical protein BaRGS_004569 [Batillaria attramentaria]